MDNEKFKSIKLLITDVDGVLTDGGIYTNEDGVYMKKFNVKDGTAVKILKDINIKTMILSSEADPTNSKILQRRAKKIGVKLCHYAIDDKLDFLKKLLPSLNLQSENIAYIGDDINDLEAMSIAGLKACPNDAVDEIKDIVDIVLNKKGGDGCFRELVDKISFHNK